MRPIAVVALLVCALQVCALDVRKSPEEYPLHAEVKDFRLGAEYMVRSFLADGHSFTIDNHLVVEIGAFPTEEADLNLQRFNLRVNGKNVLFTQTPGMVAAAVKYPDWTHRPSLEASAGMPDGGGVVMGRRPAVGRFPGDPTTDYPRRRPQQPAETGTPKEERIDYTYVIARAALPELKTKKPVAGFIFFPYDGKLSKIKSVELLIDNKPVLKLR